MWFIITFFVIIAILQLACVVGLIISIIEAIFKIEIVKEDSWMDTILARYFLNPLAIICLVMFGLIMIWGIMNLILGHNC